MLKSCHSDAIYRVATVNCVLKFKDFSRTFSTNSRAFCTERALLFCILIQQMNFTRFASGEKSSLRVSFHALLHRRYYVRLWQTANFDYFLQLKVKKVCLFQDFQGPQHKFKDFSGPGIFSCQFQDFPGFSRTMATMYLVETGSMILWRNRQALKPVTPQSVVHVEHPDSARPEL